MSDDYKLSDKDHNKILDDLKAKYFRKALTVKNPEVVITGGQPASGKGRLARDAQVEFSTKGGSVLIDPDQLRSYHPKYQELQVSNDKTSSSHTHYDAKKWSLELIEEAMKQKKNIVVDQTSADFQTLKKTVENFKNNGYNNIELKVMAVPEITSKQGIYHRYEMEKSINGSGRFVDPSVHKEIYDKLSNTIKQLGEEKIVDKLSVYDRNYKLIEQKDFEKERNRPFTEQEKVQHDYKWFKVIDQMEMRKAPFTETEIVKQFQKEDRVKLGVNPEKNYYGLNEQQHKTLDKVQNAFKNSSIDQSNKAKDALEKQFTNKVYQLSTEGKLKDFLQKAIQKQPEKTKQPEQQLKKGKDIER
ncbi:zeta toxin family protein [Acinetobacter baumannii]|nr:zeta toxin family protein [Acinetobacter baumannii]